MSTLVRVALVVLLAGFCAPTSGRAEGGAISNGSSGKATEAESTATAGEELPQQSVTPNAGPSDPAGLMVGEVEITVGDIFATDLPEEDRRLFRLANRLHRGTRDSVVRQQLLFEEGDPYDARTIEESERLLRKTRYLRDAEIIPTRYHDDRVDLEVVTRDVWTLNVGLGLRRSGGVNSTHFQVKDYNLFGTGKGLTLRQSSDVDRTSSEVTYNDHNLLGSRSQLDLVFSNNSDGSRYGIDIGRPFFSLDSRWAAGVKALSDERIDSLYDLGTVTGEFRHQAELFELSGGLSRGLLENRARRWTGGFTYQRDRFSPGPDSFLSENLPEDRTLVYPWIGFDSLRDDYLTTRNQDRLDRVEDLDLGRRVHARLGFSSRALGASADEAIFDARLGMGARPSERRTVLLSADATGRWGGGLVPNMRFDLEARHYWRNFGDHLFFGAVRGSLTTQLDPERQLLLGGDNGLRGYPLRYQEGDRSLLVTLEQRFFSDFYPWKLFHVGAAVFFDAGAVWKDDAQGRSSSLGLLKDVGAGLRLGSSRSGRGSVIHLDVAFPLDGNGSINGVQWLIKSKETF